MTPVSLREYTDELNPRDRLRTPGRACPKRRGHERPGKGEKRPQTGGAREDEARSPKVLRGPGWGPQATRKTVVGHLGKSGKVCALVDRAEAASISWVTDFFSSCGARTPNVGFLLRLGLRGLGQPRAQQARGPLSPRQLSASCPHASGAASRARYYSPYRDLRSAMMTHGQLGCRPVLIGNKVFLT